MSESGHVAFRAPNRSGKGKWIVGAALAVFAALIVMNLPHGYSGDLSRIGKGKVAVVLVRDKNAVDSYDLLETMNRARDQYAGQVEFLLTDFDTPQGRAFITDKGVARVSIAVFDANGQLLGVLSPPQTAESVLEAIAKAVGGVS